MTPPSPLLPLTRADRFITVAQWVARIILGALWLWLLGMVIWWHTLDTFVLLAWFTYFLAPINHPCDYPSYAAWWRDRANWRRP